MAKADKTFTWYDVLPLPHRFIRSRHLALCNWTIARFHSRASSPFILSLCFVILTVFLFPSYLLCLDYREELAKHNTGDDLLLAIRGKVSLFPVLVPGVDTKTTFRRLFFSVILSVCPGSIICSDLRNQVSLYPKSDFICIRVGRLFFSSIFTLWMREIHSDLNKRDRSILRQ